MRQDRPRRTTSESAGQPNEFKCSKQTNDDECIPFALKLVFQLMTHAVVYIKMNSMHKMKMLIA